MSDVPIPIPPELVEPQLEQEPFWNYKDLLLFLLAGIPCLALSAVLAGGVMMLMPGVPQRKAVALLPAQFLGYALWFVCLYILLKTRYNRPFWKSLAFVAPGEGLGRFVLYGPMVAMIIAGLAAALHTPQVEMPIRELLRDRTSLVLVGIFAITLGPIAEELAFRGFLMPLLVRSTGPVLGALLTALPFAVLHGPQYAWSWQHIMLLTFAGCAFGWIRLRTGSTVSASITHAAYNLTFFVAYLLQEKDLPSKW